MADVQHLQDENKVLTDEINEMTQEIDQQGLGMYSTTLELWVNMHEAVNMWNSMWHQ